MTFTIVAALAALTVQHTDTVIPVRPGARLEIDNFGGETVVRTWDKNAMRIVAEHGARDRVQIGGSESVVSLKGESRYGPPRAIDYRITVPVKTDVEISGVYNDVTIEGVQGSISVETVQGQIKVRGGSDHVSLRSVEGEVSLSDAHGRISVNSVNEAVSVTNSSGDVKAETVNGDLTLEGVDASDVDANTVNGTIVFDGTVRDGGHYTLTTHNGDIRATIPEKANVAFSVSTFNGDFESSFPVRLTDTRRKRFNFTIGTGSARMDLESFQGTISLERPGERSKGKITPGKPRNRHRDRDRDRNEEN